MKKGWEITLLKDACKVFADGDWIESKDQSSDGIRLVQTGNIGFGYFKDKEDKSRYISEETFFRLKCTEILPGDLLVSRLPDPVGKSCIIPEINSKMITGVDCTIIRPNDNLSSEFLCYYQMSNQYLNDVQSGVSGATRQRISRKNLGQIEIPIPPLTEQQRIVSILDEAFAAIAKAKANAEQNLKNAKELFESYLNTVDAEKTSLGDLVEIKTGKLNSNAMVDGGKYPFFTCSREIFAINNYAFDCEAILLAGNNASGDFNVKHYNGKFNAYQRTYVITINEKQKILYRYLYFQLLKSLKEFKEMSVGANTRFLKLGMIQGIQITLPSLEAQQNIVQKLDTLLTETKKLEAIYQQKINDLEELKKSVLQKAFSGELETSKIVL